MDYYFKDYNFKEEIKFIYHISDIHINLQAKHDEYRSVFKNLYKFLKDDVVKDASVIIITGDILHSKTELLPECIELTRTFFIKLSKIMPVLFIAGNHDLNVNNEHRLDALTPIYNGIPKEFPVYYLEKTGIHKFNNIFFCVTSVRDYVIIDPTKIHNPNNCKLIALYHGRVNGAQLFNNITIEGELNKNTNKTITVSCFDGYDYGLFGDIHKQQYLNEEKTIAYAGSLIQQNHGESLSNHGVLKWDISTGNSIFHNIQNDYGYITLQINNSELDNIQIIQNNKKKKYEVNNCPNNLHLRLYLNNTPNSTVQEVIAKLKDNHKIIEVSYQDITEQDKNKYDNNIAENITQSSYQNKLIEEYLSEQTDCPKKIIEVVKQLNTTSNETLDKTNYSNTGHWKLIKLEFSNLYSYGDNNVINFNEFSGIVGIIAQNHMGKSALIDIILYTLFDKFPRKGTLKDIINNRKNNFYSKITFQVDNWYYIIEKIGAITNTNRTNSKSSFYRININNKKMKEFLHEDTMTKTKNAILKYIGNYEDIIQTNISLQHNNCIFIDSENTKRKKELERILKVDFIDELIKRASSNILEKKAIFSHLENKCPVDHILKTKENIKDLMTVIKLLSVKIEETNNDVIATNDEIKLLNSNLIPNIDSSIKELEEEFENLNITDIKQQLKDKINERLELIKTLHNYNEKLLDYKNLELLYKQNATENDLFNQKKDTDTLELQKQIDILYTKIQPLHNINIKNINKILAEFKSIKQSNCDLLAQIKELKSNIKNEEDLEKEIKELYCKLDIINISDLPSEIKEFIEAIPILELEKEVDNYKKELQNKLNLSVLDNYSNASNELAIFNYIETYYDLLEKKKYDKNRITKLLTNLELNLKQNKEKKAQYYTYKDKYNKNKILLNEKKNLIEKVKENNKNTKNNRKINDNITVLNQQKELIKQKENNKYTKFLNEYAIYKNIISLTTEIEKLTDNLNKVKRNNTNIQKLLQQKDENNTMLLLIEEKEQLLSSMKEKLESFQMQMNENQTKFVAHNTNLNNLKNDLKTMKEIEKEINIFNIYNLALKQLPYMIINKIKPVLEKKINDLLSVVTNFMVKIEIENTRIDIYLDRPIYNGKPILLNNASGFERFISSLAIRLALLDISLLPKPNFIAIDEGWTSFDYQNINNVKTIFDFLTNKFDFVISISHLQSIREHCNYQINLEKDADGFSKIKCR